MVAEGGGGAGAAADAAADALMDNVGSVPTIKTTSELPRCARACVVGFSEGKTPPAGGPAGLPLVMPVFVDMVGAADGTDRSDCGVRVVAAGDAAVPHAVADMAVVPVEPTGVLLFGGRAAVVSAFGGAPDTDDDTSDSSRALPVLWKWGEAKVREVSLVIVTLLLLLTSSVLPAASAAVVVLVVVVSMLGTATV